MRVADEFNQMCLGFHQDTFRLTRDEAIRHALGFIDEKQAGVVKQFLDMLLSDRYTAAEMKGVLRRKSASQSLAPRTGLDPLQSFPRLVFPD
jgi:hypothetical protein